MLPANEQGFTVVELIIASSLLLIVLFSVYTFYESMTSSSGYVNSASEANQDARLAMDVISKTMRQSTEPSGIAGALFQNQGRACGAYVDIDKDGAIERVRYWTNGATLYWSKQEPDVGTSPPTYSATPEQHTLITTLDSTWTGDIFAYYAVGDPPTIVAATAPQDVAAVAVEIRTRGSSYGGGSSAGSTLASWIRIRTVFNQLD